MRKSTFLRLCLCLAVALFELPLMAQGVVVYKKDGTQVKFPYEEIDSIVTYNVGEDIEGDEPVTPPASSPAEAVDLGLPSGILWASCNVGAESSEEFGGYYSWGETEEKGDYDKTTYKWASCDEINWEMTKYCTNADYGEVDGKTKLELEDDVAHVKWGGDWRMPTFAEYQELLDNCTWEWAVLNGVNGYRVTGRNENSIFLPASGCRYYDEVEVRYLGEGGAYWSSTLNEEDSDCANCFSFFPEDDYLGYDRLSRYPGITIRPVCGEAKQQVVVKTGDATDVTDNGALVSGVIEGAEQSVACGIIYGTSSSLSATSGLMISTNSQSEYSICLEGLNPNTTYYYCAYAIVDEVYKYGAVCSFTTLEETALNTRESVDLGLSVKWASCNVGAEAPEEYGGYYAWGEIEEKTDYSWSTYKWCNGSEYNLTKYCTNNSYGTVDNKTALDPEDDAAHVQWSSFWRMPTNAELDELRTKCEWTWTSVNGVNGYRVTGPNGNSIFLPAAGSCSKGGGYSNRGSRGIYWSSTLYDVNIGGCCLYFVDGEEALGCDARYFGFSIRPVTENLIIENEWEDDDDIHIDSEE